MEKNDLLLTQYDRFISQLRVEVDQMFWLYNFFFVVDSALLGSVFLKQHDRCSLFVMIALGLILSLYWIFIMVKKNEWRESWLERIKNIEGSKEVDMPNNLWMWPKQPNTTAPKGGLWNALLLLPIGFVIIWIVMLYMI
jgi:hypothetical protein